MTASAVVEEDEMRVTEAAPGKRRVVVLGRGRGGVRAGDGCEVLEDAGGLFAARERGRGDVLSRQVRRGDGGEGRWILRFVEIVVRVEGVRDGDGGDDGETFKDDG